MGDLHHLDICRRDNTTWQKRSRRLLECPDDDDIFLTQVIKQPTRRGALLDLVLTNKKEPVRDVKVRAALAPVTMEWWSSGP